MKNKRKHIESINPEKLIDEKFTASYMNDSKWYKLIETLTDKLDQVYLNYKLIYSEAISGTMFLTADFKPYFIEPILYKEVEWIEIPNNYIDWVNRDNRKAGKKEYFQNLNKFESEIEKIGNFEMDTEEEIIRIYGYK